MKIQDDDYTLERWIRDSDVDGRMILFKFTDSDIPILYDCIHKIVNEELKNDTPINKPFWAIVRIGLRENPKKNLVQFETLEEYDKFCDNLASYNDDVNIGEIIYDWRKRK